MRRTVRRIDWNRAVVSMYISGLALFAVEPRSLAAEAEAEPTIAIMGIDLPDDFTNDLRSSISAALAESLDELAAFEVMSQREVSALIAREKASYILTQKDPDYERLAELGAKLAADYIVVGGLVHAGRTGRAHLQLLRVRPPGAVERVSRDYEGPPEMSVDVFGVLVRLLVRDVLAERSGSLRITCSEEEATVYANQRVVGSSPLSKAIELPEGLNTIAIEKEGFVFFRRDLEIERDVESELDVTLIPSEAYVEAHRARVKRQRLAAWGLMGLSAAFVGGAVTSLVVASNQAGDLRDDINAYNSLPPGERTTAEFDRLESDESGIATLDVLTIVGFAAAAVSAASGAYLFATNDDLDRYDALLKDARIDVNARADASVGPSPLGTPRVGSLEHETRND